PDVARARRPACRGAGPRGGHRSRRKGQVERGLEATMAGTSGAAGGKGRNLGIRGIESVDFVVHDLARSERFYTEKMDFTVAGRSTAKHEQETGERSVVFDAARVRVQCTSPLDKDSRAAKFLRSHPDGVRTLTLRVESVEHAWRTLESRGANFVDDV